MLARVVRSPTIWSTGTVDDVIEEEFNEKMSDNGLYEYSTYLIEASESVQTHSEHGAGTGLRPEKCFHVDCATEITKTADSPGETGFKFTIDAHRDMIAKDKEELRKVLNAVLQSVSSRLSQFSKQDIGDYIQRRIDNDSDEEWNEFLTTRCREETRTLWNNLVVAARTRRRAEELKAEQERKEREKQAVRDAFVQRKSERENIE